jgi:hypothetical protein
MGTSVSPCLEVKRALQAELGFEVGPSHTSSLTVYSECAGVRSRGAEGKPGAFVHSRWRFALFLYLCLCMSVGV